MPSFSNGLSSSSNNNDEQKTYYDVLGVDPDSCTLSDIKKSYRKLALLYHPDRVPSEQKEVSTVKFREVSEAYEVLSDKNRKAEYDRSLKYGFGGRSSSTSNSNNKNNNNGGQYHHYQNHDEFSRIFQRHNNHRDAFSQFNDLFQNDPFFSDAFKDMDDLFAKTFQNNDNNNNNNNIPQHQNQKKNKNRGWGGWLLDKVTSSLGIDVQVSSSYSSNAGGRSFSTSKYGRSSSSSRGSTYTSKSTRTVIENGRRITIQSMEKDGNRIVERYEGNKLVHRLVNGHPQNVGRIESGL